MDANGCIEGLESCREGGREKERVGDKEKKKKKMKEWKEERRE
jgi:hypothetical protein